ncbi:MAG: histidine kinase [Acidobacteriota bacterium]|jgi:Fis family transcriptional regulator, factor for inversion stimulation protein|nr:histidine kinase [Acidobacteriota bacterium]
MKDRFDGLVDQLLAGNIFLEEAIEVLEKNMIQRALERYGGNQSAASKQLGIHRNTLQRKLVEYGLDNGHKRIRPKPAARARRPPKPRAGAA